MSHRNHILEGPASAVSTIAYMLDAVFDGRPSAVVQQPKGASSRRRKKLWELPNRCHCPLIGTCVSVVELRKLARRAGLDATDSSDYALHASAVGQCGEHGGLSKLVQRYLDRRFAAAIACFARARGEEAVLALWRDALTSGDVSGALWAAWSHPDLTEEGGKTIYGDIHMLSHQSGAAARADLRRLEQLARDNASLRDEIAVLRQGLADAERRREQLRTDLERRLADAEARAALLPRRELELAAALRSARDYAGLRERAERMARRIENLEDRNAANARRASTLELALDEARNELIAAEAALESSLGLCRGVAGASGCGKTCPAEAALAGRCVLCVGGRTGLVDGYRRLVEAGGGRFLHHDGGQEESLHRIDAAVAGADAVVCQAGCVSHAAYWRIKEACKKQGKPCVFLKSPGVTSFARGLADIASGGEGGSTH